MSALHKFLENRYSNNGVEGAIETAVAITGTSSALYSMFGARKLNNGDLASLTGAILLAGVPGSIMVGNDIIKKCNAGAPPSFNKFYWMAAPAAVATTLGIVGWFVPAKKEAKKFCYDSDCDTDSDSDSDSDGDTDSSDDEEPSNNRTSGRSQPRRHDDEDDDDDDDEGRKISPLAKELGDLEDILTIVTNIVDYESVDKIKTEMRKLNKYGFKYDLDKLTTCESAQDKAIQDAKKAVQNTIGRCALEEAKEAKDESKKYPDTKERLGKVQALIAGKQFAEALEIAEQAKLDFERHIAAA
jgi:hypothetical protein